MNPLPNIHDHSLLEYRVDLANKQVTLLTLPEWARINPATPAFETVFDGMEGHRFGPVAGGVIFLDIEEAPLAEFLPAHKLELDRGCVSLPVNLRSRHANRRQRTRVLGTSD